MIHPKDGPESRFSPAVGDGRQGWASWTVAGVETYALSQGHQRDGAHGVFGGHRRAGRRRLGADAAMTTRRNRRQNTNVRPRPRVYEPSLRAHDSNTSTGRETLVRPSKGKRLRILRVRVIQEVADGRRLYEVYFGEGDTIAAAPGKAVDHSWTSRSWARTPPASFPATKARAASATNHSAAAGAANPPSPSTRCWWSTPRNPDRNCRR